MTIRQLKKAPSACSHPLFKLAPVEPTDAMLEKGRNPSCVEPTPDECRRIWRAMMAEVPELDIFKQAMDALIDLRKQCAGVSPFANAVATKASVKEIRRVGNFMASCDRADAVIAAVEQATANRPQPRKVTWP